MNSRAKAGLILAFCTSVGVHGVAYASLSSSRRDPAPRDFVSEVSIEVKPLPAAAALPELPTPLLPEPAPPKGPAAVPAPQLMPTAAVPNTAPAPSAPSPAPAAALDLSGVTLTNDTGTGFAMPNGNGSALHGPIGSSTRAVKPAPITAPAAVGPALVAANDLSVHPVPPALAGLLRANYPEEARQRGLRGAASVRARIDADGVVRSGRVVSESAAGFGAACRRTVLGSHWSAPRDENGGAVATEIVYTCHFEVDQ
jgi:TonB family protein